MFRTTRLLVAAVLTLAAVGGVLAQAAWEAPLRAQLERIDADRTPETLRAVTPVIERIAASNPDAWLPNYYAAHFNLLDFWIGGSEACPTCLDEVDSYLEVAEAADANSEVKTLRASYYQAMLNEHPMRAPYYGPKAGNLLEAAAQADPTNPRAASLMGQNLYYTPAMFGGGAAKAAPHLARAVELFEAEAAAADRDPLLPRWGADRASSMHKKVSAEAKS